MLPITKELLSLESASKSKPVILRSHADARSLVNDKIQDIIDAGKHYGIDIISAYYKSIDISQGKSSTLLVSRLKTVDDMSSFISLFAITHKFKLHDKYKVRTTDISTKDSYSSKYLEFILESDGIAVLDSVKCIVNYRLSTSQDKAINSVVRKFNAYLNKRIISELDGPIDPDAKTLGGDKLDWGSIMVDPIKIIDDFPSVICNFTDGFGNCRGIIKENGHYVVIDYFHEDNRITVESPL